MDLIKKIAQLSQNRQQFEGALGRFVDREEMYVSRVADALVKPRRNGLVGGPNGPWKDYMFRGIAQTLYGSEEKVHEIDLSAYSDDAGGRRLLNGEWDCYSGQVYEASGKLARAHQRHSDAVFVFSHLDRANPSVFDALYPILDQGMTTTWTIKKLDFRQAILIFSIDCILRKSIKKGQTIGHKEVGEILKKKYQIPFSFIGRVIIIV